MSDDIKISASGVSTASQKAERATMHIRVSSEAGSQSEVAQNVTSASSELQQLFKGLAYVDDDGDVVADAQVSEWSMGTLSTGSFQPWRDEKEPPAPTRYTASINFDATFRDFKELGRIAAQLLEQPHVQIDSISWDLTAETRAALEKKTRRGAVRAAIAKAEDYAMECGRTRVIPREISDALVPRFDNGARLEMARMAGVRTAQQELDFTPETIQVESTVSMKFDATWV